MYITLVWIEGWVLDSTGFASQEEAEAYIERQCKLFFKSEKDYLIAEIKNN